ncbi:helix-turn-helix domain-containing protein [Sphingopyxis flava]|uniref:Helix-turn-helix n=1 Tax=Sphingopyxis flava TaxID=1507287 RepID=A0A1T4ZX52_9SPHN|nr:Helix-turn-helix [Sphingopyxis flava]
MDNLRDIRRQLGLTQIEMGEQLGLDQSTISRFESGALAMDKRTKLAVQALLAAVATCGVCDRRASDPACLACTAPDCGLRQREAA